MEKGFWDGCDIMSDEIVNRLAKLPDQYHAEGYAACRAEERERCARVVDSRIADLRRAISEPGHFWQEELMRWLLAVAATIRARE